MNHVNDIARTIRDHLAGDPQFYKAAVVQGEPDTERADYPNRDGEWHVYLVDEDTRTFKVTVVAVEKPEAYAAVEEAES